MATRSTSSLDKLIQKKPSPVPNKKKATKSASKDEIKIPADGDWRTTDEDEINRRRLRAREEAMQVKNLTPDHPVFSDFQVSSASAQSYTV